MGRFISVVFYIDRKVYYFLRFRIYYTLHYEEKNKGVIYVIKLLIGAAIGWFVRGACALVWLHIKTYSEVITCKAELDNDWKETKELLKEYRNSN